MLDVSATYSSVNAEQAFTQRHKEHLYILEFHTATDHKHID